MTAKANTRARKPAAPVEWLTVADICAELKVARSTWNNWRAAGKGPRCHTTPGGRLRVRRDTFDAWVASREETLDEAG